MTGSPTRQALLIGAPVGELRGVERDVDRMGEVLTAQGFRCRTCVGSAATRAGILEALHALEAAVTPATTTVVYFSGHGGQCSVPTGSSLAGLTRRKFIVPVDHRVDRADELVLLTELHDIFTSIADHSSTLTVFLDCGYSVVTSRSEERIRALPDRILTPSQTPHWWTVPKTPVSEQQWVSLHATGKDMPAFECDIGGAMTGYFTWGLCDSLSDSRVMSRNWEDIIDSVRRMIYARRRSRTQTPRLISHGAPSPVFSPPAAFERARPKALFVPAMPRHAADHFGRSVAPSNPPDEFELIEGAAKAVAAAVQRAHERGLATTHIINGKLVQLLPDGSERALEP